MKKKSNLIAYHFVGEGFARDKCKTDANPYDPMIKALLARINRKRKFQAIVYNIYPEEDN